MEKIFSLFLITAALYPNVNARVTIEPVSMTQPEPSPMSMRGEPTGELNEINPIPKPNILAKIFTKITNPFHHNQTGYVKTKEWKIMQANKRRLERDIRRANIKIKMEKPKHIHDIRDNTVSTPWMPM